MNANDNNRSGSNGSLSFCFDTTVSLRARLAFHHPAERQRIRLNQPPGEALDAVVAPLETVPTQTLPDPLIREATLQGSNDDVVEGLAEARRTGIPGGRVSSRPHRNARRTHRAMQR